jgi:hypothetical protein
MKAPALTSASCVFTLRIPQMPCMDQSRPDLQIYRDIYRTGGRSKARSVGELTLAEPT